jgi:hypothetical protein
MKYLRFEIYSTDESGSLNWGLKLWAANDRSRGLVSIFGWGQTAQPEKNFALAASRAKYLKKLDKQAVLCVNC